MTLQRAARDSLLLERMDSTIAALRQPPSSTQRSAWRSLETIAIGATTVRACESDILSLGCIAGVVVTGIRVH